MQKKIILFRHLFASETMKYYADFSQSRNFFSDDTCCATFTWKK